MGAEHNRGNKKKGLGRKLAVRGGEKKDRGGKKKGAPEI